MSRIDVQTLVLAFEKRISLLEKNPPDKISTAVVVNLLEKSIEDEIKNHFIELIRREIVKSIKKEFEEMRVKFVQKTIENILTDELFRLKMEKHLKHKLLRGLQSGLGLEDE